LIGGAIFPLLMGYLTDALHTQRGALAVIILAALYLLAFSSKLKR
jgi:fucose permease